MKITNKILLATGILGPVLYFILLISLGEIWDGYDAVSQSMSEIGAVDSPYMNIMNIFGFSLLGVFIMLFAFGLYLSFKKNILNTLAAVSLFIGGLSMFFVGFFPATLAVLM
ncbi:MAG: DUF998 domain-containing protein [bacterium]|nr:DUF998 domain-containing protein [bacterium]